VIYIFHGDDQFQSRQAFSQFADSIVNQETLKIDNKEYNLEKVNLFLNSPSLFSQEKTLIFINFFSLVKSDLDSFKKIVKDIENLNLIIWQDKTLKVTETAFFPKAKIEKYSLPKLLFTCLNALKPKNQKQFIELYLEIIKTEPFELLFFWFKNRLRQNLTSYSPISPEKLKDYYLKLIELENDIKPARINTAKSKLSSPF
jgi:hypothetical protein